MHLPFPYEFETFVLNLRLCSLHVQRRTINPAIGAYIFKTNIARISEQFNVATHHNLARGNLISKGCQCM